MSTELADLERRTYRAAADDGLADILLGAFLVFLGAAIGRETPYAGLLGGLAAAFAFTIWKTLRRTLVEPRAGYVRLQPARSRRIRLAQCLAAVAMALVIAAGLWFTDGGRATDTWFPGLAFAIPVAIVGYFAELDRWYFYAAAIMVERLVDSWAGGPADWLFWPSGTLIALAGAVMLLRFLRRYPRREGSGSE